jgi:ATP-binding cassette subfamily C protein
MEKLKLAETDFKRLLWAMAFFSLFTNLLMLAIPLYMLQIYDRVLPSQSSATLTFLSIIAALALIVLGAMEVVRSILANRTAARLDADLADTVLQNVIRSGASSGGSSQPMRDLVAIRNIIASRQAFALLDLPFAVVFIAILYLIHPDLFWITIAGAVTLTLIALLNQYLSSKSSREQIERSVASSLQTEYLARNADSLVAMGMVNNVINYWGTGHAEEMVQSDRAGQINAFFTGLSRFLRLGLQIVILGYGALLVLDGEITPGMIFASSIVSGRALQPIDQVIASWRQLAAGMEGWRRLKLFLRDKTNRTDYSPLPTPDGNLAVTEVSQPNSVDPAAKPILNRISFELAAGKSVAVIGPSGSGKSTLARIIIGAVKPRIGSVRLDGHEISNWDPEALGRHIGYLAQDVDLLPGTIAQNIARFEPSPDSNKFIEAAKLAHAEDLIKAMPKGYDTPIGPGGVQISGGEKQRIGLARAFYGNPRLLVLDEPNSSLDKLGEIALNRALAAASQNGITVFIITQRESALARVDKIMRIQGGQISDYGDRDEIIAKYRQPAPDSGTAGNGKPNPGTQTPQRRNSPGPGSPTRGQLGENPFGTRPMSLGASKTINPAPKTGKKDEDNE